MDDEYEDECPYCEGLGFHWETDEPCERCGGDGVDD